MLVDLEECTCYKKKYLLLRIYFKFTNQTLIPFFSFKQISKIGPQCEQVCA